MGACEDDHICNTDFELCCKPLQITADSLESVVLSARKFACQDQAAVTATFGPLRLVPGYRSSAFAQ